MAKTTDKILAERMLQLRERGYKFGSFLRLNAKGYAVIGLFIGAVLGFLAYVRMWPMFAAVAGYAFGVFRRDLSWFFALQRNWEFSRKVIDWDKVKRAADGETLLE